MRVTVDSILRLIQAGHSFETILKNYPYLEMEDLEQVVELDIYNKELNEAMKRISEGEFYTQAEVEKIAMSWNLDGKTGDIVNDSAH